MPIQFACSCGKRLKVADESAGKKARCPGCGAALVVPTQEPDEADFEYVEDDPPAPPAPPEKANPEAGGAKRKKSKKKPKSRPPAERRGTLSDMYMEQAREEMRRDELRARAAGGWGRDEEGGWTMFGVHLTAGVLSGAGLLFVGILAMVGILIFGAEELGPRAYAAAIICTAAGAITLIKSLFFGEEE